MATEWRKIHGFGNYEISDSGIIRRRTSVKRFPSGSIVRQCANKSGYRYVYLRNDEKRISRAVHLLVIEAFVGRRPPGYVTHHKDLDKTNNHVRNLEYIPREKHGRLHGLLQYTPPELKKQPKPLVVHLVFDRKPFCAPGTQRDDLPLTSNEAKITCVRCLFRLGRPPVGTCGVLNPKNFEAVKVRKPGRPRSKN